MAVAQRKPVVAQMPDGVNFGDLGMYVAGGGLPAGDYALEFNVMLYQATKADGRVSGPMRLGVMITAHSLTDPTAEPKTQFMSMGTNADKSFAPNPDTGKGIIPIPGAVGGTLNNQTNWHYFLKSMYDCGLPQGIFSNDCSVLDGVWVHTDNVPEPEDRKGFASKTAEVAEERRVGTIPVVTEIKDDGKPWEGTGGIPAPGQAPAKTAKPGVKPNGGAAKPAVPAQAAAKPAVKPAVKAPVAAAPAEITEEDLAEAAASGVVSVLEKSPNGTTKLQMRTGAFKYVTESHGPEMAQAVINTYFGSDEALNTILSQMGYIVSGIHVKSVDAG